MLFLNRTDVSNETVVPEHRVAKAELLFKDANTGESFKATLIHAEMLGESEDVTRKGETLFKANTKWRIESDEGVIYIDIPYKSKRDVFYPKGWDTENTNSAPVALLVQSANYRGSVKIGIECDDWMKVSRGDIGLC